MIDLLPCPFCGEVRGYYTGLRTVQCASELYRGKFDFWIECPACGATGPARRGDHTEERSSELAAERWNRRASPATPIGGLSLGVEGDQTVSVAESASTAQAPKSDSGGGH